MYASNNGSATAGNARRLPLRDEPVPGIRSISDDIRTQPERRYGLLKSTNGNVKIANRAVVDSVVSTNGNVHINGDAEVGSAHSTNGNVVVGNGVRLRSVNTACGDITLGFNVNVEAQVESTTGDIRAEHGCRIKGRVASVGGNIVLNGTDVKSGLAFVGGNVTVTGGSHVHGGLHLQPPVNEMQHLPCVVIGANSRVDGQLVFEAPVTLYVHSTARTGGIVGASRIVYSTLHPPHPLRPPHPLQARLQPGPQPPAASPLETIMQALAQRVQVRVSNTSRNTVVMGNTSGERTVITSTSANGSTTITGSVTGNVTHYSAGPCQIITMGQPW